MTTFRASSTGRRRRRLRRRIATVAVLAIALFLLAGAPFYGMPRIDPLRHADAIFVLGGHGYERYPYALELAETGLAPRVVMSNPAGTQDIWLTDLCTHQRYAFRIQCFDPQPATTKGEARELRELADQNHWNSVIVVTFRPHISRARYILQRCFDGELLMTESPADISVGYWLWSYVYQTAGYARATLQKGC